MDQFPPHRFHIPVMGLAYTIDSPIKVARFGISSVISIIEDKLIELMRKHYYPTIGREYFPIPTWEKDYREKRITDYLDLVNDIVTAQLEKLRAAAFETGSEIVQYFEMLPDDSDLKKLYRKMVTISPNTEKENIETYLRTQIRPGSIDVNIMTKIDRDILNKQGEVVANGSDAITALRGYMKSKLSNSSVVFSAGMNPRLYNYLGSSIEFDPTAEGEFKKKVIVKVSDYRSALIQGKYLAKKGIWVSEFRIESGLNCGGHAFATDGYLLGPILNEFKNNRQELIRSLFEIYQAAISVKTGRTLAEPPALSLSVQGGIGTYDEDDFLHRQYDIESTGWGTPFLLVPEATTVDQPTLELLSAAKEKDMTLSRNSPLGVRFHYLKGTSADHEKNQRIKDDRPGSPCTEKLLAFNTEFTEKPICTASQKYQALKIEQLRSLNLPELDYKRQLTEVLDKECLCVGLSNAAAIRYDQKFVKNLNAVTICPGPNIVNFSRVVSLSTMIDHIYGRNDIVTNPGRPHMFLAELRLYLDYLNEQMDDDIQKEQFLKKKKYYSAFVQNLKDGINYYQQLHEWGKVRGDKFIKGLELAVADLEALKINYLF